MLLDEQTEYSFKKLLSSIKTTRATDYNDSLYQKKNTQLFYYIDGEGNVYHTVCYLLGEYYPNIRGFTNEK